MTGWDLSLANTLWKLPGEHNQPGASRHLLQLRLLIFNCLRFSVLIDPAGSDRSTENTSSDPQAFQESTGFLESRGFGFGL